MSNLYDQVFKFKEAEISLILQFVSKGKSWGFMSH